MRKEFARLRRRTFLMPLWLMALSGLAVVGVLGWVVATASTTTVVVMRHAETQPDGSPDAALSAAGLARAERLAQALGGRRNGVQAIYATASRRTQETAAPLAARLGLTVEIVDAGRTEAWLPRLLRQHRAERVLVIGDSSTVPGIVERLSGMRVEPGGEGAYGELHVVSVPRFGRATVLIIQLN